MPLPPQLFKVTPFEVTIGAANSLTITGLGLTGGTLVVPNGDTTASVVVTDTQITCSLTIPAGKSAGARFIQVTNSQGGSNRIAILYQGNITDGNLFTQEQNYPSDPLRTAA